MFILNLKKTKGIIHMAEHRLHLLLSTLIASEIEKRMFCKLYIYILKWFGIFLEVHSERMRSKGHSSEWVNFCLSGYFFLYDVVQTLPNCPEICNVLILGDIHSSNEHFHGSPKWDLIFTVSEPADTQRSIWICIFLWLCKIQRISGA